MKKLNNVIIIILLMISMLFLFQIRNYAVNENSNVTDNTTTQGKEENKTQENGTTGGTVQNTSTQSTNSTPTPSTNNTSTTGGTTTPTGTTSSTTSSGGSSNNNNTKSTTAAKSSNANLTTLGIKPGQYDFTGFNNDTLSYEAKVPEEVESIEIFAILQDKKATIKGTGTRNLQIGKNALEVVITAEDGTTKTFIINVTRGEDATQAKTDSNEGLKELSINGLSLSPMFQTNVYEYKTKYIGENTQLEIVAEATNKDYIIEITGNEELQEGENTITILVSKSDGTNVATYQIIVNKSLVDEEAIAREKEEQENEKRQTIILIGAIIGAIVIIGVIIFMIIKRKRNEEFLNDEEVVSLYDDEDEEDEENEEKEEYDEELPKALIGQKKSIDQKQVVEEDENFEEMPKQELKEKYLDNFLNKDENYEKNIDDDYYVEETKKRHSKGKRFKE